MWLEFCVARVKWLGLSVVWVKCDSGYVWLGLSVTGVKCG